MVATQISKVGGDRMRRAREDQELCIEHVAGHLGVTAETIEAWESGERVPPGQLDAMAMYYAVSVDSLLAINTEEQFEEDLLLAFYRPLTPEQREKAQIAFKAMCTLAFGV